MLDCQLGAAVSSHDCCWAKARSCTPKPRGQAKGQGGIPGWPWNCASVRTQCKMTAWGVALGSHTTRAMDGQPLPPPPNFERCMGKNPLSDVRGAERRHFRRAPRHRQPPCARGEGSQVAAAMFATVATRSSRRRVCTSAPPPREDRRCSWRASTPGSQNVRAPSDLCSRCVRALAVDCFPPVGRWAPAGARMRHVSFAVDRFQAAARQLRRSTRLYKIARLAAARTPCTANTPLPRPARTRAV